jgi:hypothetical protein
MSAPKNRGSFGGAYNAHARVWWRATGIPVGLYAEKKPLALSGDSHTVVLPRGLLVDDSRCVTTYACAVHCAHMRTETRMCGFAGNGHGDEDLRTWTHAYRVEGTSGLDLICISTCV